MSIVISKTESVRPKLPVEPAWQRAMQAAIRDPLKLAERLQLPPELVSRAAHAQFPTFAPEAFIARMKPGDPHDPLLRQVLPLEAELEEHQGFTADPTDDSSAQLATGVLQKYAGRVLLITTGNCAVHCRYCFRRHYPYEDAPHAGADWEPQFAQIAADPTLHEVILSGGDPLTLGDPHLARMVDRLAAIPHLSRLRIHTRLPIMIPERVTSQLLAWLSGTRLTPIVVLHANHAQELDDAVAKAVARLAECGAMLLNQAVLLRGVNDSLAALVELSERLAELRVMPYYLHQLDRVQGAAHFEVPVAQGRALMAELRDRLPGYLVPRYVTEVPHASSKILLA